MRRFDPTNSETMKAKYRILTAEGFFKFAGTGKDSWFDLDTARSIVDYGKGEQVIESDGVRVLWQVF